MAYSLIRDRDGAGDSGPMLVQYRRNPQGELEERTPKNAHDIELDWVVRVGSYMARTYSSQDYWTTTYVTEILEKGIDAGYPWIKFKTNNSVYTLKG